LTRYSRLSYRVTDKLSQDSHRGEDLVSALVRYLLAATLVRAADGGAAVGLVALAVSMPDRIDNGAAAGGTLAALLTLPHLLGPIVARPLDQARDSRWILAAAFAIFGTALGTAACLLGHAPIAVVGALIVTAGSCGPLLTGGLSSRLKELVGPDIRRQRRAEGWDAATYGVGATLGPALVAGLAAVADPLLGMLALTTAALAAAPVALLLPVESREHADVDALGIIAVLKVIVAVGPLRRIMTATLLTAAGGGALTVIAVVLGPELSHHPGSGPALSAAYGVGSLTGSLAVAAFPLRGEPERLAIRLIVVCSLLIGACSQAPSYPAAVITFALAGAGGAVLFTATLAVRSDYSPDRARAQIFVSIAGIKMAAASGGTALAGLLVAAHGPRVLLVGSAALTLLAALIATADRRLLRSRQDGRMITSGRR
jgi:MFS family permease